MISVSHLSKRFADNEVLKDINLQVKQGEVVAIIGPSGSGKSTLLRCLNLLEKPNTGTIRIGEVVLNCNQYSHKDESNLRKQSSMVFQHYNLFKNKTALENITYPLRVGKKMNKNQAKELGISLLTHVGMLEYANQYPSTLSGGQQQRVAIARALAVRPKVLLFDEPTSALDPERVHEVLQVMLQLAKENITMIIVTHEMEFAKYVADRIIFMANGIIIEEGVAKSVIDNPQHALTQRFLRQLSDDINFEI
ncbi:MULTISPECIES: amino acid ABC transporter ATP-binding protein [unclassified Gilliamella]|uniref:amino acid ABC transporter ATP-binding protein n=1 Tax=unclassified Gilliamella TaxID=2685620 RepID=UPI00226A12AB|nr:MULTISPECIES: amino acid ABC transporter ATP-binding protein [unclassified Gilliamella]MCX8642799.1 amino acid ABC transporter ATP-binding protein [Gilliamella sp. B3835]MCX8708242.1 amino acid ABC transporter ATP-binding protein [Gilliamella sp. B3783]MCX8710140.1 amino acid ABC transporter ATP-binding protein [Gilliamella sp. B3780]MCX8712694.1 amino acid ABC transporter ATP-binding protein [Gilliamella sp. B3468]MCX8715416.1 amino acid ABC transporter ATP-binding protein [Gilliamella sp.